MNSKPRKFQNMMNLMMHSDGSAPKFLEGTCVIERNEKKCVEIIEGRLQQCVNFFGHKDFKN